MAKPVLSEVGKSAIVGFSGRALPLEQRSEADLWKLAEMAVNSRSKSLKTYFSELPTQADIDEYKSGKYLQLPEPQPANPEPEVGEELQPEEIAPEKPSKKRTKQNED